MLVRYARAGAVAGLLSLGLPLGAQSPRGFTARDLFRLQSVGDVEVSSSGTHVAYTVLRNTGPGRPQATLVVRNLTTGATHELPPGSSGPRWAPDGRRLAFMGDSPEGRGLMVSEADGSGARLIAPVTGTNHPLPSSGASVAWAPDGRPLALVRQRRKLMPTRG